MIPCKCVCMHILKPTCAYLHESCTYAKNHVHLCSISVHWTSVSIKGVTSGFAFPNNSNFRNLMRKCKKKPQNLQWNVVFRFIFLILKVFTSQQQAFCMLHQKAWDMQAPEKQACFISYVLWFIAYCYISREVFIYRVMTIFSFWTLLIDDEFSVHFNRQGLRIFHVQLHCQSF